VSAASDVGRGQAILDAIARRLQTVAISDPALRTITFTVHVRAHGGWPQGVQMTLMVQDDFPPPAGSNGNGPAGLDACGPTRRKE